MFNNAVNQQRDTLINANTLVDLGRRNYTPEEYQAIMNVRATCDYQKICRFPEFIWEPIFRKEYIMEGIKKYETIEGTLFDENDYLELFAQKKEL